MTTNITMFGNHVLRYPAKIRKQRGQGYIAMFDGLPGCVTEGSTLTHAIELAKEALSGWLYVAIRDGQEIPLPCHSKGRDVIWIAPDLDVAIPLYVIWSRKQHGLSQAQVAHALGISQQAYRKFETPGLSNLTLKTVDKLSVLFGWEIVLRQAA